MFWTPPSSIIAEAPHLMIHTEFPVPNSYGNSTHSFTVLASEGFIESLFYLPSSSVRTLIGKLAGPFPKLVAAKTLMS